MLKKLTFNRNIYSFFNRNKTNIIPLNATQKHFVKLLYIYIFINFFKENIFKK